MRHASVQVIEAGLAAETAAEGPRSPADARRPGARVPKTCLHAPSCGPVGSLARLAGEDRRSAGHVQRARSGLPRPPIWTDRPMTTPCPHHRESERSTAAQVGRALNAAAAGVLAAEGRLTEPRRRGLERLLTASRPVKAYDLVAAFHKDLRVAKPATVYRALEFLETRSLVHRLSTTKSYVACNPDFPGRPSAFLICECCGASRQIPSPAMTFLTAAARGYTIDRVTLKAQGRCAACRPATGEYGPRKPGSPIAATMPT